MSYKVAFFGVPASTSAGDVLAQVVPMARELRMENGYSAVYMAATPQVTAARARLRILYFAAPGAHAGVSRDFFTERWRGELFEMVYNDQQGIFLWRHYPGTGRPASIITIGPYTGVSNVEPRVDYPQKAFTNEQLVALHRKPEAELNRAEARAVMEYDDAITIGLAHHGFDMRRNALLELLSAKTAWSLLDAKPTTKPFPTDAGPIASYEIESYDLSSHGLQGRA
jgi:hypothetical protein